MKTIGDWRITLHGVDSSSCFQGHGVAYTKYTDCATGIGNSEQEALSDALEQLACSGEWDVDAFTKRADFIAETKGLPSETDPTIEDANHECDEECPEECDEGGTDHELHVWVSIDVTEETEG